MEPPIVGFTNQGVFGALWTEHMGNDKMKVSDQLEERGWLYCSGCIRLQEPDLHLYLGNQRQSQKKSG